MRATRSSCFARIARSVERFRLVGSAMVAHMLVTTALIALILAAGGHASPAADPPTNGRIVFGFLGRLIQANADGTGEWPLSAESLTYAPGDWSPDGTRLAIVSQGDIYTVDPRGRIQARLTFSPSDDSDPSWSRDGTKILFASARSGRRLWVMNADGTSPRPVTPDSFEAYEGTWSPDGSKIAMTASVDGPPDIYVMDADGTDLRRLTDNVALDEHPSWSPDGSRIAFDSNRDGSSDVYAMAVDGADVRQLTTSPADDTHPEWSPDGTRIAFLSNRTGQPALLAMSAGGSEQTQLSSFADATSGPAWQPLPRESLAALPWGRQCTIWGTQSADLLVGTPGTDVICGRSGDDRILGGRGNDVIAGEEGADNIVGGPGTDIVSPGAGDDIVDLRDGSPDTVVGGDGHDVALVDRRLDDAVGVTSAFDPDPGNLTRGRPITAPLSLPDRPPEYAVDGHLRLIWGASFAPAWIEVDLGKYATVARIQLVVAQTPSGETSHVVLGRGRDGRWRRLTSFQGVTHDGQVLRYTAPRPWRGIRWLRISTRRSPSWVAWKEIQAYAPVR